MPESTVTQSAPIGSTKSKITTLPRTLLSALHELNEEIVYVLATNEIAEINAPIGEVTLRYMSPQTFKSAAYSDRFVLINGKRISLANEWMKWPERRKVNRTVYEPGQSRITPDGNLNTWFSSPNIPKKGDITLWLKYLDHMFASDPTYREWFLAWLAYPIQNPGTKLHTACVFWSTQTGTGKSTLAYIMREIYGQHNCSLLSENDLDSNYNGWAVNKVFIEVDEMRGGPSAKKRAERLKSFTTRQFIPVDLKYQNRYQIRDTLNYYFTTNHIQSLHLDPTDRRFFVHDCGDTKLSEDFFRRQLGPWLNREGFAAIHHYLLNEIDLSLPIIGGDPYSTTPSPFSPGAAAPQTASRERMILSSRDAVETFLIEMRETWEPNDQFLFTLDELYQLFRESDTHSKEVKHTFKVRASEVLQAVYKNNQLRLSNGKRIRLYTLTGEGIDWPSTDLVSRYERDKS